VDLDDYQTYNCLHLTNMKKTAKQEDPLEKELKEINSALNRFLKQYFTIELECLQEYLHNVKDLLIELTTRKLSPLLTNVFSKFSNILQPFTSYSYDLSLDSLKQQVSLLHENNHKIAKKTNSLKQELDEYRTKANRLSQFVYMLRVNNVNVDELYRRGVMNKGSRGQPPEEEEELPRTGVELLRGEDLLSGLD
jgi:hypothetical protein